VDKSVADPVQPNTLYAENGDLFVSRDGGQTWTPLPRAVQDPAQNCSTTGFAVSPSRWRLARARGLPAGIHRTIPFHGRRNHVEPRSPTRENIQRRSAIQSGERQLRLLCRY
jgi:hypothetical protein